jgi:hypothetical protein
LAHSLLNLLAQSLHEELVHDLLMQSHNRLVFFLHKGSERLEHDLLISSQNLLVQSMGVLQLQIFGKGQGNVSAYKSPLKEMKERTIINPMVILASLSNSNFLPTI